MSKTFQSLLGKGMMYFAVYFVFAFVGLIGFVIPNGVWEALFGVVIYVCCAGIGVMLGYNDGIKAVKVNLKPHDESDPAYRAKHWSVARAFLIPAIAVAIPTLVLTVGLAVGGGFGAGARNAVAIYYSGYASICNGGGAALTSSASMAIGTLLYIPVVIEILAYAAAYLFAGAKQRRIDEVLKQEVDIIRRG